MIKHDSMTNNTITSLSAMLSSNPRPFNDHVLPVYKRFSCCIFVMFPLKCAFTIENVFDSALRILV